MRQIFQNRFLRGYQFSNSIEQATFVENVSATRVLTIEESDGQNPICYVGRNSLSHEAEFAIAFRSDLSEENLNLVSWNNRIIFDSGCMVYFVTPEIVLQTSLELTSPLIGLHVISESKLLILEEVFMRIVDRDGRILKSESFDLISDVVLENKRIVLSTDNGNQIIDLD